MLRIKWKNKETCAGIPIFLNKKMCLTTTSQQSTRDGGAGRAAGPAPLCNTHCTLIYWRMKWNLKYLRQGLGYSGDSAPKNSSRLKLSNHVWHCGSKTHRSHLKKSFSPKNHFCVTHFPLTWLYQSITDIWPLTTLLLILSIVFSCSLAYKKFSWTTKNCENSSLC